MVQSIITLALIAWIMLKRFQPRALDGDTRRRIMPFVYMAIGVVFLVSAAHTKPAAGQPAPRAFGSGDVAYLVLIAVISFVVGLFRGTTLKLWVENGVVMRVYRPVTAAIWIGLIIVRVIAAKIGVAHGVADWVAGSADLFFFGLSSLGELITLLMRARGMGPERGGFRRFAD